MHTEIVPNTTTVSRGHSFLRPGKIASLCSIVSFLALAGTSFGQELTADPATPAVKSEEVVKLDEFLVKGIRGSAIKAIEVKRNSMPMLDAVVAEDIGKFPDNNAIESLQRVSGIQVTDYGAGQIGHVTIRGLDDVTTTLNGRNIFTASGLSLSLPDVPTSLIGEIDVYKSRAAEQIETGIAGVIDIKTRRPFDFPGQKIALAVRGTYVEQAGKYDPNISALYSNRWKVGSEGKFGALFNISYATQTYRDQSVTPGAQVPFMTATPTVGWVPYERIFPTDGRVSENPIWQAGLDAGLPHAAGSTLKINGVDTPYVLSRDAIFQSDATGKIKRPAANLSLQFAPDKNSEYTFEAFYDGYRQDHFNDLLFSFVDWWGGPLGAVNLFPGTNIVKSRDSVGFVYGFNSGDLTSSKTDSYQASLGGKWDITPDFKLKSEFVYQTSVYDQTFRAMQVNRVAPSISVDFNSHDGIPAFSFPGSTLTDPGIWNLGQFYDQAHKNKGSAGTFTTDGTLNTDWGIVRRLKFGVRYDDRKASEAQALQEHAPLVGSTLAAHPEFTHINSGFYDGRAAIPTAWAVPDGYYITDHIAAIRALYGLNPLTLVENFDVDEKTAAAYLQVDEFKTDIAGHKLDGQFGVRYVHIKTDMTFGPGTSSVSKSKVLPSLMIRYEITPQLMARFAYGETIRRPNFVDLNPAIIYTRDVTNIGYGTAAGGNSNLKPTEAKNYDLSLEYYFDEATTFNVTAFKRKIDGLVVPFRKRVTHTDATGPYDYILSQPDNASNGKLDGIEVGGKYYPKNLPEMLKGLGVEASYTHLKSSQDIPITNSAGQVVGTANTQFPSVSPNSYNAILAYERSKFGARLSYTWRSAFYHNNEAALFANPLPIYFSAQRNLSAQLSYQITDDLVVTLEGNNLTNDIQHSYYGESGAATSNFGNWIVGRTYTAGVRYSF